MSHTPNNPDYGHTTGFYQGQEAGINEERKRVVKLIQDHAPDLDTLRLIALIEGNQPDTFEYVADGIWEKRDSHKYKEA
jgi:hypothetical protein